MEHIKIKSRIHILINKGPVVNNPDIHQKDIRRV